MKFIAYLIFVFLFFGCSTIHSAVKEGDLLQVKKFVEKENVNINTQDEEGYTPLMNAAEMGNFEMIKYLIAKGAKINVKDNNGNTALLFAISQNKGDFSIADFLILKGADINVQNNEGRTILMNAAEMGNFEMIKYLIVKGAKINVKDNNGNTALLFAISQNKGNFSIADFLILKGADINVQNNEGRTILMEAVLFSKLPETIYLLGKNANYNIEIPKSIVNHQYLGKNAIDLAYEKYTTLKIIRIKAFSMDRLDHVQIIDNMLNDQPKIIKLLELKGAKISKSMQEIKRNKQLELQNSRESNKKGDNSSDIDNLVWEKYLNENIEVINSQPGNRGRFDHCYIKVTKVNVCKACFPCYLQDSHTGRQSQGRRQHKVIVYYKCKNSYQNSNVVLYFNDNAEVATDLKYLKCLQ